MTLEILGLSLSTAGEVIRAITILTVHHKVKKHHKIDKHVQTQIGREEFFGSLSIFLIIFGYLLQVASY